MKLVDKEGLRILVRGTYSVQKLRIQMGNRLAANFRAKLGLPALPTKGYNSSTDAGDSASEETKEGQKILKQLKRDYTLITDYLYAPPRHH